MGIPGRVAAWLCVCVLGTGLQARAENASPEWQLQSYFDGLHDDEDEADEEDDEDEEDEEEDDDDDDDDDESCGPAVTERRHIVRDVFEYSYRVWVGKGAHDFITLHRVVRENASGSPVRTQKSVFLVHGDVWGFRGAFLSSAASGAVPRQQSIAVFLAQQGVDVWGIDLRWVNVPAETTDFSFMKGWNLELHASDVERGLKSARSVRACKCGKKDQMVLLGWSRGATISYAYLNKEAQLPKSKRQVSGFIPVDMAYTFAPGDAEERQAACLAHMVLAQLQAAGQYEGGGMGLLLRSQGGLAISQPDAASPYVPGFTNRQAGLLIGAATYLLQQPAILQDYHWTGGQFGPMTPSGLTWTRERFFFDGLLQASPYQSIGEQVDTLALWCGAPAVPYDDYLREVTVPVLYVGAAGGVGGFGLHSLSLLGSKDVTSLVVQRFTDEAAHPVEYGHADLFLAEDAEGLVWTHILTWVQGH